MNDAEYLERLEEMQARWSTRFPPDLGALMNEAERRLDAAGVPPELGGEFVFVILEYWLRLVNWPEIRKRKAKIAAAALRLADALKDSGISDGYRVVETSPNHKSTADCTLEDYLHALVAGIRNAEQDNLTWMVGDAVPAARESRSLKRFIIRRIHRKVDALARWVWDDESAREHLPSEWVPRESTDDVRAGYGNNAIVARITSILLCADISPQEVADTLRR